MTVFALFIAGGLGVISRYLLSRALANVSLLFPFGILACNLLGCLLIGGIAGYLTGQQKPTVLHTAIITGYLGGFTTFSSYALDSMKLVSSGKIGIALLNITISTLLGIILVWLGYKAGEQLA